MAVRTINDIFSQLLEAKTRIKELYQRILDDVVTQPDLAALNSTSKTAIFRLWAFVMAVCMWLQEAMWAEFRTEVDAIIAAGVPGTDRWLAAEAKKFQYGDALEFEPTTAKYYYAVADTEKQIIAAAAVQSVGGAALVKVAKLVDDELAPLAVEELSSFSGYLDKIRFTGSNIRAMSAAADILRLPMTVYYDPIYSILDIREQVEAAVEAFLKALPFNGEIRFISLVDAVQKVSGVKDARLGLVQAKSVVNATYLNVDRVHQPFAGYAIVDPDFSLYNAISYVPE